MPDQPFQGRPHAGIIEVPEADQHPDGVPGETDLAPAIAQPAGGTPEAAKEKPHGLPDPRVLPTDPEVGEDEEAPVRGDVLGTVQFEGRRSSRVPLACRVL